MSVFKPSFVSLSALAVGQLCRRWGLGLATLFVWLTVGLSAGAWTLLWLGRSATVELLTQVASQPTIDPQQVLVAVSGTTAKPAADTAHIAEWRLLGVVSTSDGQGVALLSRNGERARPVAVGRSLPDSNLVLQAIANREVRLGTAVQGPTTSRLSLPVPAPGTAPEPVAPGQ